MKEPVCVSVPSELDIRHNETIAWARSCRCIRCHWPTGRPNVGLCDFCKVQHNRMLAATRLPK